MIFVSIGYLYEQDLELTPLILPDRANLCGRGHPKIDPFHTKSFVFPFEICKYSESKPISNCCFCFFVGSYLISDEASWWIIFLLSHGRIQ